MPRWPSKKEDELPQATEPVTLTAEQYNRLAAYEAQVKELEQREAERAAEEAERIAREAKRDKELDRVFICTKPHMVISIDPKLVDRVDHKGKIHREWHARTKVFFNSFLSRGVGPNKDSIQPLTDKDVADIKKLRDYGGIIRSVADIKKMRAENPRNYANFKQTIAFAAKMAQVWPNESDTDRQIEDWLMGVLPDAPERVEVAETVHAVLSER